MVKHPLPAQFAHLQSLADVWALPTERERHLQRLASSIEDLDAAYAVLLKDIEAILDYLNQSDVDALSVEDNNLLLLTFGLAEITPAVQIFRMPGNPDGFDTARIMPSQ